MTEYVSDIKQINADRTAVYGTLSDLTHVRAMADRIPQDKGLQIEAIDADNLAVIIPGAGKMQLHIVEREENKTIKLETVNFPVKANAWIQLLEPNQGDTRLRLTLHADLNMMLRSMLGGKLKDMVNQMATMLSMIPYQ